MRKTQLVGVHIGNDATVKTFSADKAVINFSVADTEHFTKDGVKTELTVWIECKWFMLPDKANKMAAYLTKGKKMYLEGKSEARAYIKEDKAVAVEGFLVSSAMFLDKKEASGSGATPASAPAPQYAKPVDIQTGNSEDDDLPF